MIQSPNNDEFIQVKVSEVGFTDVSRFQGVLVLETEDGKVFPISSFSGEVAEHIERFRSGDRTSVPTIYKMFSEFADRTNMFLNSVEIFEKNGVMRSNIQFVGRNDSIILENYRASDSIALATFYDAPISMKKELLERLSE